MIRIDATSTVPPFEQVRMQLASRISDGALVVGARLPTVRGLANDLGLAVNTVARAYRELEAAGLIETRGRGGTIVTAGGNRALARLHEAAQTYATVAHDGGFDADQAVEVVRATLSPTESR